MSNNIPLILEPDNQRFDEIVENHIKQSFILKVYTILWNQLLFTSLFISSFHIIEPLHQFIQSDNGNTVFVIDMYAFITHLFFIMCHPDILKNYPSNWISLSIFTSTLSYIVSYISSFYPFQVVLLSGGSTLTIFTGLTLYAFQTKIDYTVYGNSLIIILLSLIIFGYVNIYTNIELLNTIYLLLTIIIFSGFIVYDTQLIVDGKNNRYKISTQDYVMGALTLYLDIINIFISFLDLLSGR